MDTFYLVTEVAIYRRRYVLKNPPREITKLSNAELSTLVGSLNCVELPEEYVLLSSINDIKYSGDLIDLKGHDSVIKQCVGRLTPLESLDEPDEKIIKVKKTKKEPLQAERGQTLTVQPIEPVKASVKPKKQRVDWAALGGNNESSKP